MFTCANLKMVKLFDSVKFIVTKIKAAEEESMLIVDQEYIKLSSHTCHKGQQFHGSKLCCKARVLHKNLQSTSK